MSLLRSSKRNRKQRPWTPIFAVDIFPSVSLLSQDRLRLSCEAKGSLIHRNVFRTISYVYDGPFFGNS